MKNQNGFTLIELMATTVVLAIIVTTAVSSFDTLYENKNIPEIAKLFERSMRLARTEAINRNTTIDFRPISGTDDWSQGWYLEFTDPTTGNVELIRSIESLPGESTFTSETLNDDDATRIRILPSGQAVNLGTLNLSSPDNCSAGAFTFQLLGSGLLKKSEAACP